MILLTNHLYQKQSLFYCADSFYFQICKLSNFKGRRTFSSLNLLAPQLKNYLIVPNQTGKMHKRFTGKNPKILGQASKVAADALKASAPEVPKTPFTNPKESSSQISGIDNSSVTPTKITPATKSVEEPPSTLILSKTPSLIPVRDLSAVIAHTPQEKTSSQSEPEQAKTQLLLFEPSPNDPDWILCEKQKMQQANLKNRMPVEKKGPIIKEELDRAEKYGLIDYSTTGRYYARGNPRLTQQGYNYQRYANRLENTISNKAGPSAVQNNFGQYTAGIVAVHSDTEILTSVQQHVVVTKPNQPDDGSVIGFGYLTSASGTKIGTKGVAGPGNPLIDQKTKFESSTTQGSQYCAPIIPPIIIKGGDFEEKEAVTTYLLDPENPHRADQIANIDEATSKKEPKVYQTKGLTVEKLQELNDLYEQSQEPKQEAIPNQVFIAVIEDLG